MKDISHIHIINGLRSNVHAGNADEMNLHLHQHLKCIHCKLIQYL